MSGAAPRQVLIDDDSEVDKDSEESRAKPHADRGGQWRSVAADTRAVDAAHRRGAGRSSHMSHDP